jgi:hypothetical protein
VHEGCSDIPVEVLMSDPEKQTREPMTSELPCNPHDEWRESLRFAFTDAEDDEPQICRGID